MDKLNYSVSLRAKGLSKNEIIKEMLANGFDESEITYYLKTSDELYIKQLLNKKQLNSQTKSNPVFKTLVLIISLVLLFFVFYGYATIGLIGLFIFWSIVKYGTSGN